MKAYFDRVAPVYGESWTIEEENRLVASRLVSERGRILEIGCGNGRFLCNLDQSSRVRSFGLDYSFEMLKLARSRVPDGRYVAGDATRLPFKKSSFETVVALNMMHNHPSPAPFVAEIARLKSRRVLIDIRNLLSPIVAYKHLRWSGRLAIDYRPVTRSRWRKLLCTFGLTISEFVPVPRPLSDPRSGFRWRHLFSSPFSRLPGMAPCYVSVSHD